VLQEMYQRKKEEPASVKSKADDKHAQFGVVSKRDSTILPDAGRPSGWIIRSALMLPGMVRNGGVKLSLSSKP